MIDIFCSSGTRTEVLRIYLVGLDRTKYKGFLNRVSGVRVAPGVLSFI